MEILSHRHRRYRIATSIIVLSGIFLGVNAFPLFETTKTEKRAASVLEKLIHLKVNNIRRKHNLPDLKLDSDVAEVARKHSEDMALKAYVAHENKQGELVQDRLKKEGIVFTVSAENIMGFLKDQSVLRLRVDMVVNRGLIINFTDRELKAEAKTYNQLIHPVGYSAAILIRMTGHRIEYLLLKIEDKKDAQKVHG